MDVRAAVDGLGHAQGGLVCWRDLRAAGVSRKALRYAVHRGRVLRRAPGLYALPATPRPDDDVLLLARSLGAVASHETAAAWWGIDVSHDPEPRHQLTVPRHRGRLATAVDGVRLHRSDLPAEDVVARAGLRLTTPSRTVVDLARRLPLPDAVAAADGGLRRGLVTVPQLQAQAAALRGPGAVAVRRAVDLVDPSAESVLESLLRVRLVLGGVVPAATQYAVVVDGVFLARVDLAWPGLRLAVEADGFAYHADRSAYRGDRRRLSRLAAAGWWVLRVSWEDVVGDPDGTVDLVRRALRTACDVLDAPWPALRWEAAQGCGVPA